MMVNFMCNFQSVSKSNFVKNLDKIILYSMRAKYWPIQFRAPEPKTMKLKGCSFLYSNHLCGINSFGFLKYFYECWTVTDYKTKITPLGNTTSPILVVLFFIYLLGREFTGPQSLITSFIVASMYFNFLEFDASQIFPFYFSYFIIFSLTSGCLASK